jgi:ribosomal protein S27E
MKGSTTYSGTSSAFATTNSFYDEGHYASSDEGFHVECPNCHHVEELLWEFANWEKILCLSCKATLVRKNNG